MRWLGLVLCLLWLAPHPRALPLPHRCPSRCCLLQEVITQRGMQHEGIQNLRAELAEAAKAAKALAFKAQEAAANESGGEITAEETTTAPRRRRKQQQDDE